LLYKAGQVPVGADQVAHVEITREVARRFNHVFGREPGFEENAEAAIKKMGKKASKLYSSLRKRYTEGGDGEALATAQALLKEQQNITLSDKERLMGYLEGTGKVILPEPQALLTPESKMPGLDGRKMSKSYNNTISLREESSDVEKKIRTMRTDVNRVRRDDPGNPDLCPVWQLHKVYSTDEVKDWVQTGCRSAGIGCVECKGPVIDAVKAELIPIQERAEHYDNNPDMVKSIIQEGSEKARESARATMEDVRHVMGLGYR
jgi:tryptophanyl-tRNA synthetase